MTELHAFEKKLFDCFNSTPTRTKVFKNGTKYSRMDQVKSGNDSL